MSKAKGQGDKQLDDREPGPTRSFDSSVTGPGSQIGPFRIERELGRGAVGVVYLAHDTKLDRKVAIKSLPPEVMANPKARSRFSREAKLLASLNHPNIATIHDVHKEAEGAGYLVLEYIPGQTLAERIAKGRFKLQESLSIALQIAEAVSAAHDHSVIHRDLKPGNIKITSEGKVKVLDFGLAKAVGGEAVDQQSTVTEPGRVIGTPAYMSPEQARGQATDKRSDIWAFGCILYEMLTTTIPFRGETISDTLANILQTEPNWQSLPENTPANIRSVLRHCLEKDPRRRLQHIGDAGLEISETLSSLTANVPTVEEAQPAGLRKLMAVGLVCMILIAVVTGLVTWSFTRPAPLPSQPLTRFVVRPVTAIGEEALWHHAVAISPDGRRLAYIDAGEGGGRLLYLRNMDSIDARALPGTEGAISPFFSPDGEWIGFYDFTKRELRKTAVSGGTPSTLCKPPSFGGGCWGPDNTIIFATELRGLRRYTASGGMEELTVPDANQGEGGHVSPQFLARANAVLFTSWKADDSCIEALLLQTGERRVILNDGTAARYVPTGHLLFVRSATLYAAPFDLDELKVKGTAVPVISGISASPLGSAHFAFSETGTLVYVPAPWDKRNLVWVDRTGVVEPVGVRPRPYTSVRLSPGGDRLAVTISHELAGDVWILDRPSLRHRQLTFDGRSYGAVWTRDGISVIFDRYVGRNGLFLPMSIPTDGSGKAEPLTEKEGFWAWSSHCLSPDGKLLLGFSNDIWVLPVDVKADQEGFLTKAGSFQRRPDFSPDGKWVAYDSSETGRVEVYVLPYPGPGGVEPISTEGGYEPLWSQDGKELFYRSGDKMMAVSMETEPEFIAGAPRELFEGHFWGSTTTFSHTYDLETGGRFLMIQENEESAGTTINVVLNWFEELKRLVPTGND